MAAWRCLCAARSVRRRAEEMEVRAQEADRGCLRCLGHQPHSRVQELHNHVRVHDRDGTHQALQGHRSTPQEPEEDCQGDTESNWPGSDAQCTSTPLGHKEEPPVEILVDCSQGRGIGDKKYQIPNNPRKSAHHLTNDTSRPCFSFCLCMDLCFNASLRFIWVQSTG